MLRLGTLTLALVAATSTAALAGKVDDRREHQYYKIEEGRQSGSITWREGIKLRKEQQHISNVEKILKSDGYLSAKDRRLLNKLQNQAASNIKGEDSDGWRRVWWLPRFGR